MITETQAHEVVGTTVYSEDGDKIGKVGQLFLDDVTGRPEFVTVNTGMFGTSESFVPVETGSLDGDRLTVPFSKAQVKDAPHVELEDGHLDEAEESRLFSYYGLGGDTSVADRSGTDTAAPSPSYDAVAPVGHDTSGPTTDDAMTRSEEHLSVGTTEQESGRVRLRKYVTTEQETVTVPVRKEQVVLEREPITDANRTDATGGPAISEEEHEVVLHEERAVVDTVVEPVERVRIGTETVVEDETVTGEVRQEHIEIEDDTAGDVSRSGGDDRI